MCVSERCIRCTHGALDCVNGEIKGLAAAAGNARVKTNYQLDPLRHVKILVEMQQPLVAMVRRIHDTALWRSASQTPTLGWCNQTSVCHARRCRREDSMMRARFRTCRHRMRTNVRIVT